MHVEKVRFDEVFDVAAPHGNFSFRSGDRTEYGVKLRNHVIPRSGSTFAIAFAEPGKWSTVLGWRDLAAPDVTLTHPAWTLWLSSLGDIAVLGLFFIAGGLLLAGPAGALAVTVAIACIASFQIFCLTRLNQAVKRALLDAGLDGGRSCT